MNSNKQRSRGRNNGGGGMGGGGMGGGGGGGGGGMGGGGMKKHMPQRNTTFDSNGPEIRIRGNAHQVLEKYLALARDASSQGDRIQAENFYQHAEHYFRVINASNQGRPRQVGTPTPAEDQMEPTDGDGDEDGQSPSNQGSEQQGGGEANDGQQAAQPG